MKGVKMISGGLVILALIFAFNVPGPGASAQILDGVWFKIIVEGQGKAVHLGNDELLGNEEFKLKVFIQFIWDDVANEYVYAMYIKNDFPLRQTKPLPIQMRIGLSSLMVKSTLLI